MASASPRQSYGGGPPEPHHHNHRDHHSVILNPSHPPAPLSSMSSASRSSGGAGPGGFKGSSAAGKSDRKSGGGSGHRTNTRVPSLPSAAPSVPPSQSPNFLQAQQYSHEDMVVNNIAASSPPNNNNNDNNNNHPIINNSHPQPHPQPYQNSTQLNQHQNATTTTSRKTVSARNSLNTPGIVTIGPDDSEDRINATRAPQLPPPPPPKISGPSLAGPASGNRTLLQPYYDPTERPNRASASPSIASLVDPQPPPLPSAQIRKTEKTSAAKSETAVKTAGATSPTPNLPTETKVSPSEQNGRNAKEQANGKSPKSKPIKTVTSAAPSPPGNGLLSGDMFNPKKTEEVYEIPTIVIHVPLNGETNKYVNFAKLAEEQYGLYALNPRLAREHQQKLACMSGDEMMLDISDSESAMEDKMMMSGVESTNEATKKKPTKKRKIMDAYDSHDPFIDDSETLWELQQATTKDGFFVYSGALVPEGEKVTIERADGTIKRGRGRGRASGTTRATATKQAAPRKPRITKKEKERLEREKEEQQRLAALQQKVHV